MKRLSEIQQKLKAPKSQYNAFGKYKYRSCEDILEAVKPLLGDYTLTISDEIVLIGERYYIKATTHLFDKEGKIVAENTAYAREEETKKGMDSSQITGAASSYARKYALNGMFLIDDTKDADATNKHGKSEPKIKKPSNAAFLTTIERLRKSIGDERFSACLKQHGFEKAEDIKDRKKQEAIYLALDAIEKKMKG